MTCVDAAIEHIAAGRMRLTPMAGMPATIAPADELAAYALQHAMHRHYQRHGLGEVAGYKIGCTSEVMQRYLHIASPCAGGVLAPTLRQGHGEFEHAAFVRVGVECELAVVLGEDIGPDVGVAAMHREALAASVEAVMCAIEVVDDRWQDFTQESVPALIADDFFGAGGVLGEACARWHGLDLATLRANMRVNGARVGEGRGADILGHPLAALEWLVRARAQQVQPGEPALRGGDVVFLGSMVQTQWLDPGDRVEVAVEHLGEVGCVFE
jgi:2-oxo-3-hexenedioate decarboxylase/2-keto-4-pentenoate hydratase